jgi:hypothetical protein
MSREFELYADRRRADLLAQRATLQAQMPGQEKAALETGRKVVELRRRCELHRRVMEIEEQMLGMRAAGATPQATEHIRRERHRLVTELDGSRP